MNTTRDECLAKVRLAVRQVTRQSDDTMTAQDALRFVAHESEQCRNRDQSEALCLLLPAIMRVLRLPEMEEFEARAFRERLRRAITLPP
jgi:hypothetical protein